MLRQINFKVSGKPIGKGRPRFTKSGHVYTPNETKQYETRIKNAAWAAMKREKLNPTDRRVTITASAYFEVPKSYNKQKRIECQCGIHIPKRPDIDNIAKSILDGCNGIAFKDDCQVWHLSVNKRFCDVLDVPHINVKIQWDEQKS